MIDKNMIKNGMKVRVESRNEGMYEGVVKYWNPITEDLIIEPGKPHKNNTKPTRLNIYFIF